MNFDLQGNGATIYFFSVGKHQYNSSLVTEDRQWCAGQTGGATWK